MAGSWTVGKNKITDKNNIETGRMLICTFTADAGAATVPDLVIAEATGSYTEHFKWVKGWHLRAIETDPGSTNPTANYDITVTNSRWFDIAGAAITNRSASLTQTITPRDSDGVAYSPCWDDASGYTIAVSGNSVNSASAAIRLFFVREPMLCGSADSNLQVGNADVSNSNPVPVSDAGGPLTVDGSVSITTTTTLARAVVSASTSGDNTLVAAVADKKTKVLGLVLIASGDVDVRLGSGAGGTALTGVISLAADGNGFVLPTALPGMHWLETGVNTLLNLELSAAVQVSGLIVYEQSA